MRWPLLLFVGWLTIFPSGIRAEDPSGEVPPPDPSASTPDLIPRLTLLHRNPAAHFHLALGRLQLDRVRYRKGSQTILRPALGPADASSQADSSQTSAAMTITETLHVSSVSGNPMLHYSLSSQDVRITIEADGRGVWRIESNTLQRGNHRRMIVQQMPGEPILMRSISDTSEQTLQATTWLHLREAEPAVFAESLEPIVDELLWPYRFGELAETAHRQSLQQSSADAVCDATLAAWIDDLRSTDRVTRLAADRQLTNIGISLLPRLASVDESRLDAEQRHRLRKIQAKLRPRGEDDAARLANLIRDDFAYWRLAGQRLQDHERQLVDSRFRRIGGYTPLFDPSDSPRVAAGPSTRIR